MPTLSSRNILCALLILVAAVFCWLAPLRPAFAEPRQSVLVWVDSELDRALVERLRGQLSDLELDLSVVEVRPAEVEPALALIWFTHPERARDRLEVHIAGGRSLEPYVREIGDGAPIAVGTLSSATLEAAALVVREALRDLAHPEPPGPKPAEPKARTKARPVTNKVSKVSAEPRSVARLALRGELGWHLVLDGAGWFRRQGPTFALGVSYRSWEGELFSVICLPARETDPYGTIRLRRQEVGFRGRYELSASRSLTIAAGLRAGVALYARSAERLSSVVVASGDRVNLSAVVGPELRFGWAPGGGPLELAFTGGLLLLPAAPRIGYQVDGDFEPSISVWRLQPTLGVGLGFSSNRGG